MTDPDLTRHDIQSLSELIRRREVSPLELTEACLIKIKAVNPRINAFLSVLEEEALSAARKAESEIMQGAYRGPLHGIPFAAKDIFMTAGLKTTSGSRVLADFVPEDTAEAVTRLQEAGAVLIGKTNMHEFAFGVTSHNPHYGHARNPWDPERITGGSSGGSAAAVAASCVPLALGTDTGGSIRIPAALCGVTGLKPTYGRVSKRGVFPLAWSLDHVGPMTRTAADAALALEVLAGHDPADPYSLDEPVADYQTALSKGVKGLKIGVPDQYFFEKIDPEVKTAVEKTFDDFRSLGAEVRPLNIPELEKAAAVSLMILLAEAASALEKYHRRQSDLIGRDVKARLDVGAAIMAVDYINALRFRSIMKQAFAKAFSRVDLLLTPGVSIPAPKINQHTVILDEETLPVGVAVAHCTRIYNMVGIPSLGLPCGLTARRLPVGIQIAGKPCDEATVLRAAQTYQTEFFTLPEP